jgi:hypothetical protein
MSEKPTEEELDEKARELIPVLDRLAKRHYEEGLVVRRPKQQREDDHERR